MAGDADPLARRLGSAAARDLPPTPARRGSEQAERRGPQRLRRSAERTPTRSASVNSNGIGTARLGPSASTRTVCLARRPRGDQRLRDQRGGIDAAGARRICSRFAPSASSSGVTYQPWLASPRRQRWVVRSSRRSRQWSAYAGLALVIAIWLSTFFLQVPQHAIHAPAGEAALVDLGVVEQRDVAVSRVADDVSVEHVGTRSEGSGPDEATSRSRTSTFIVSFSNVCIDSATAPSPCSLSSSNTLSIALR